MLVLVAGALLVGVACGGGDKEQPEEQEPTAQVIVGTPPPVVATPEETTGLDDDPGQVHSPTRVSLDWLGQPVDVPPVDGFAARVDDQGLAVAVQAGLAGSQGSVSVVVHSLEDGRYAALNERQVYYAASTFKLGIMYEVYRQRDAGLLDLNTVLTLEQKYVDYDLGTLDLLDLHAGDTLTVGDAVRAMIIVSDTPTAVLLQDTVGGQTADATLRNLGIEDTSFNNRELPATAADMTVLLEAIVGGSGVSGDSRYQMLQLLLQEGYRDGIAAGVPEGTAVAHKTGSYAYATHDVALVWGPAGPYTITVMTDQQGNWPLIAQVSNVVWDYFAANP